MVPASLKASSVAMPVMEQMETMPNMSTAMPARATWGVSLLWWERRKHSWKAPWRLMANMTRAPAFMHERAKAKKLTIAPIESGMESQGTLYMEARTLSGVAIASRVLA